MNSRPGWDQTSAHPLRSCFSDVNRDSPFAIIDLQRVIDNEVCGTSGVDQGGVPALFGHSVPHGCQVHHGRDPPVKKKRRKRRRTTSSP